MENEMPIVAFPKKLWNVVRVFFFMVRKGICKRKLLLDLNLMLKRGKIAGKAALGNLLFHQHSHQHAAGAAASAGLFSFFTASRPPAGEYEFSCSNTPAHHSFLLSHIIPTRHVSSKRGLHSKKRQAWYKAQYECIEEEMAAISTALEMMALNEAVEASPVLPGLGFGRSPMVRQLRVTDSPFPVSSGRDDGDCHVDEAAEEFIKRFYSQLRRQPLTDG